MFWYLQVTFQRRFYSLVMMNISDFEMVIMFVCTIDPGYFMINFVIQFVMKLVTVKFKLIGMFLFELFNHSFWSSL